MTKKELVQFFRAAKPELPNRLARAMDFYFGLATDSGLKLESLDDLRFICGYVFGFVATYSFFIGQDSKENERKRERKRDERKRDATLIFTTLHSCFLGRHWGGNPYSKASY